MVKCLVERCLEFSNGEETVNTKIGFNELPNWVEKHPYFLAACKDGSIKAFEGSSAKSEEVAADAEKAKALKAEIAELEEKLEGVKEKGDQKVQALREEIAELEKQRDALKGNKK